MKRRIFASLEQEGLDTPEIIAEDVIVTAEPPVESDELELTELSDAVEIGEDTVAELDEGAIAVERIRITIEEALQDANGDPDGGMSDGMAAMADVAVANVSDDLGLGLDEEGAPEVIASTEAFRAPKGRLAATQVSLESVVETLKRIWTAIKNAIIRAWEAVKSFFAKMFGGVKKIKERATALKAKAAAVKEEKGGKIKVSGAGKLSYGTAFTAENVQYGLIASKEIGAKIFGSYADSVTALYKGIAAEALKEAGKADSEGAVDNANIADKVENFDFIGKPFSGHVEFVLDSKSEGKVKEIVGGDGDATSTPFKAVQAAHLMGKANAPMLNKVKDAKKGDEGTEIEVLKKGEVEGILNDVIGIATLIESKKAKVDQMNAAAADFRKGLDAALAKIDRNMAVKSAARAYLQLLMRCGGKPWNRPVTQYSSHMFGVMRSALALAERSLSHHGAPAKTEPTK